MSAAFWDLANPVEEGWTLDSGYKSDEAAWRVRDELEEIGWDATVVQLATIEHQYPADSPDYHPDQRIQSARWCVLCRSRPGETGE